MDTKTIVYVVAGGLGALGLIGFAIWYFLRIYKRGILSDADGEQKKKDAVKNKKANDVYRKKKVEREKNSDKPIDFDDPWGGLRK